MGSKDKKINQLREEVAQLKERLQLSEEQARQIEEVENLNLQRTEFHLNQVKESTGEILTEDVTYCLNLSKRIVEFARKK